jgi:hypothetical protein
MTDEAFEDLKASLEWWASSTSPIRSVPASATYAIALRQTISEFPWANSEPSARSGRRLRGVLLSWRPC